MRPQEPLVWTSALGMGPSCRILDSAAVTPTGLDMIAQSVMSTVTYCCFSFYLNFVKYSDLDLRKERYECVPVKQRVTGSRDAIAQLYK